MADRPYLLLQSRDPGDAMRAHEVACFARALGEGPGGIRVLDVLERAPTADDVQAARGVLMGGSGDYSCLDPHPWIARFRDALRDVVVPSGVPTFASCFGFQVLTLALGGEMVRDPEHREVGTVDVDRLPAADGDPLFSDLPPRFAAQAGHNDRATRAPAGTDVLASSPLCPVNAFRVRGRPVWATQFHPELDAPDVGVRYLAYLAKYARPEVATLGGDAPFLKSLRPSPAATAILARFARLCAERR
jgi:GMP synthase (glutamine-hydrolysing)